MKLGLRARILLAFALILTVVHAVGVESWRSTGATLSRTALAGAIAALLVSGLAVLEVVREVGKRNRALRSLAVSEAQLREANAKLKEALANVKTLSGLLPICSRCKKVRDDMGYWGSVERYISQHTDAKFSHGVCPDCFPKLFPGIPMPEPEAEHV